MKFLLNTIRLIDYDQATEFSFGDNNTLKEKLAIAFLNTEDFKTLNLSSNSSIKISNEMGKIVVKVKVDDDIPAGMIVLPVSIWSNQLTKIENNEITYKNIEVNVEITEDDISDLNQIIQKIKGT